MEITIEQLREALLQWELTARRGECCSPEESAAMTPEAVASDRADYLWRLLAGPT